LCSLFMVDYSTPPRPSEQLQPRLDVLYLISVIILRMTQLILVVDFKLLRGFGLVIYFAYGRLIFPFVFVVTVIVVVFGAGSRRWPNAFGLNIAHKFSVMRGNALKSLQCSRSDTGNLSDGLAIEKSIR
jgi:hypothetical protein